jgi:quercetin dioxygenase-like cupin family protein
MTTSRTDERAQPIEWVHKPSGISNIPGFESGMRYVRRLPGVQGERHYHPGGHEWFTVVSGSLVFKNGDQPEKLLTAGQGDYITPGTIHCGRNPSATETVVLLLFYLKPVDEPLIVYA